MPDMSKIKATQQVPKVVEMIRKPEARSAYSTSPKKSEILELS